MESEVLLKQPPQALDAEQAVLGSMLLEKDCIAEIIGILRPGDFYVEHNREIFETIYSMFNLGAVIDPVTVINKMGEAGTLRDDTVGYFKQLMLVTPTAANAVWYANIVRDKAMLRALATAAHEIADSVYDGSGTPSEILELAEKKIYALRKGDRSDSLEEIGVVLHRVFDNLSELALSDSAIPGLSTGLKDLDRKINGLNKSDLVLIAARPAMGKTSFALNIAMNVAMKYPMTVAFFSLEMSREQLGMRLLSGQSFVDSQKMATGKLSPEEWNKLALAASTLSMRQIRVDDNPSITVAEMKAALRRLDNLGLVVIDYLQLMTSSGYGKQSDNRVNVVSDISRSLKIMAKELNVPVVCLSQLSRANESRTDKRPMLSDLRESGAIEQDADVVMFLYRDDYYNPNTEEKNVAECIVSKNRHGETGTVKLQWLPQYTTFADREWRHKEG